MRLLDELRQPERWDLLGPNIRKALGEAQVIVADQVTEYMFALNEKEYWNTWDFPNMTPPFKSFWIETVKPSRILSEEHGTLSWDQGVSAREVVENGNIVRLTSPRRPDRWGALFLTLPPDALLDHPGARGFFNREELLEKCRCCLGVTMFVRMDGIVLPFWAWTIPVMHDGTIWRKYDPVIKEETTGLSYTLMKHTEAWVKDGTEEGRMKYKSLRYEAHAYGNPLFLAVCFMHAKNATLTARHPDRTLNRRREQRGHKPLLSYKVLEVGPIRRVLEASRQAHEKGTDIQLALHRCRGHFKTYTSAAPLLGRHVGTYFWEEQVRGHGRHAIRKEYRPTTKETK